MSGERLTKKIVPASCEQLAFERCWKRENPDRRDKFDTWLVRSDVWGADGYEQPCVHFEWRYFKAGAAWARRQK